MNVAINLNVEKEIKKQIFFWIFSENKQVNRNMFHHRDLFYGP